MPKREDINKVLIIGSGPIIIGPSLRDLTTPEHRPARRSENLVTKSFWSIPTRQPL